MTVSEGRNVDQSKAARGGADGQIPCPLRGHVDADECFACRLPCVNGFHVVGRSAKDPDGPFFFKTVPQGVI